MTLRSIVKFACLAGGALSLGACTAHPDAPRSASAAVSGAPVAAPPSGPALWKVADEDTTIYLFGTVHALPEGIEWYRGPVAEAIASAQVLVTEIEAGKLLEPAAQQAFLAKGSLPEGQTLRGMLDAGQRAAVEGALTKLGMPVAALDRVEPWFAAMTLSAIPLIKGGYKMNAGVELAIEGRVAKSIPRQALETVEGQLNMFDTMPMAMQIAYLVSVAKQIDKVVPGMNGMVDAWKRGDADGLAALMNAQIDDPAVAERLLYARNRDWAQWVEARLAQPGTVFVAVGAGHLAGQNSVQDYLARTGVKVTRTQ